MASVVCSWVSLNRLIFLVFLGLCTLELSVSVSYSDVEYNKYDIAHQIPGLEDFPPDIIGLHRKLIKRSLIKPDGQSQPRTDNATTGDLSSQSESITPDKELKDKVLTNNSGSNKTGGNYQSNTSTTLRPIIDDKPSVWLNKTSSPKNKWHATIEQITKNQSIANSNVSKNVSTESSLPTAKPDTNAATKPSESSKTDGKPSSKKAETEMKPPKPEPTKSPIGEDKASKKAAAEDKSAKASANVTSTSASPVDSTDQDSIQIGLTNFPEEVSNKTLRQHNVTRLNKDEHQYYNSSFIANNAAVGLTYWINMTDRPGVQVNELLSQSHRRAATVKLSFDFPFYGHLVRNVTIATGGFLYTGEYVHSWLAATQYIAPLMANFDTSLSNQSFVKYVDNGTAFTVQWEKVVLQDKPRSGDFTFQATLHRNGDIVFVYQNVPVVIESIQDDNHPVKVGLSDAYIIDRTIFFVRRKTIYEYHRVNFERQDIKNWTVIYLNALPTCLEAVNCSDCLTRDTSFKCTWCPGSNRCSTGMDRHRQEWLLKGCDRASVTVANQCPAKASSQSDSLLPLTVNSDPSNAYSDKHSLSERESGSSSMGVSGIIGILFLVALVATAAIWLVYSYRNPHSASGQFLIRYRPSTWSWRRGEARYTAATIHM